MRLLANENLPATAISALRSAGHDTVSVKELMPGARDSEVIAHAVRENRILLTFDKDFGELARGSDLPPTCGVVLFRIPMPKAAEAGGRIASILDSRADWHGHFSVVEPGRIRMRPLASQT